MDKLIMKLIIIYHVKLKARSTYFYHRICKKVSLTIKPKNNKNKNSPLRGWGGLSKMSKKCP